MVEEIYWAKIDENHTPPDINMRGAIGVEFGRRYRPIDDPETTISVYHVSGGRLRFFEWACTVEVAVHILRKAVTPQCNEYNATFRIIGTLKARGKAKSKIEQITGLNLQLEED